MSVSDAMQSGAFEGQTDDRLKDEDNVAWVMRLPDQVRDDWLTTLQWGRVADRLVENVTFGDEALREAGTRDLAEFRAGWERLRRGDGAPATSSQFADLFARLAERWEREGLSEVELQRWDSHLDALWRYRRPQEVIHTVDDYKRALLDLSGTFFQTCPYQPEGLADAVGALGALDQLYNNIRDRHEDTLRGIRYVPPDLLDAFGIAPADVPESIDRYDPRGERLAAHVLATVAAELRLQVAPLFSARLHPSWVDMLHSVCTRHSRVEYVARLCRFNAAAFAERYWALVTEDLARAAATPPG